MRGKIKGNLNATLLNLLVSRRDSSLCAISEHHFELIFDETKLKELEETLDALDRMVLSDFDAVKRYKAPPRKNDNTNRRYTMGRGRWISVSVCRFKSIQIRYSLYGWTFAGSFNNCVKFLRDRQRIKIDLVLHHWYHASIRLSMIQRKGELNCVAQRSHPIMRTYFRTPEPTQTWDTKREEAGGEQRQMPKSPDSGISLFPFSWDLRLDCAV